MNIEVIRKVLGTRPFKAVVFHLENGEKQVITHPEIIVTDVMIMAADDDGLPVLIAPEAVSAIRRLRRTVRPRKGSAARRR